MKRLSWTTRLELALAEPQALRVLDKSSIFGMAHYVERGISEPSVERWIQEAVKANRLQRVVRGLYLNRLLASPARGLRSVELMPPRARLYSGASQSGYWNLAVKRIA